MASKSASAPRVAIIRNYSTDGQWGREMLDRIGDLVHETSPSATIQHYHPIDGGNVPNSSDFDLVILTGGTWDLTGPVQDPWVVKLVDWIQNASANNPHTKVLGICWGHQLISYAFGGKISYREAGTLVSIESKILDLQMCNHG